MNVFSQTLSIFVKNAMPVMTLLSQPLPISAEIVMNLLREAYSIFWEIINNLLDLVCSTMKLPGCTCLIFLVIFLVFFGQAYLILSKIIMHFLGHACLILNLLSQARFIFAELIMNVLGRAHSILLPIANSIGLIPIQPLPAKASPPVSNLPTPLDAVRKARDEFLSRRLFWEVVVERRALENEMIEAAPENSRLAACADEIRQRNREISQKALINCEAAAHKFLDLTDFLTESQLGSSVDQVLEQRQQARTCLVLADSRRAYLQQELIHHTKHRDEVYMLARYSWDSWVSECSEFFNAKNSHVPYMGFFCTKCINTRCQHSLRWIMSGSGKYSRAWLTEQSVPWHPDRYAGTEFHREKAKDIFDAFQALIAELPEE